MTRTSKRLTARAAARQRQAKANEDQRQREQTELDHATEFEVARMRRDDTAATMVAHEIAMAHQVDILLALGNTVARVAELTAETEAEVKRLRKLANDEARRDMRLGTRADGGRRREPIRASADDTVTELTRQQVNIGEQRFRSTERKSSQPPLLSANGARRREPG